MKLKLKELNPNPFKKMINGGKLDQNRVDYLKSPLKDGHTTTFPVFKDKGKVHLVSHHHRVEALKQMHSDEYEVEVTFNSFDEDQAFRNMVNENITQRSDEMMEVAENLNAIRTYLKKICSAAEHISTTKPHESGSVRGIADWLNKQGEVMSVGKIQAYLKIYDKLDKRLLKQTHKNTTGQPTDDTLGVEEARILSQFDKKDQLRMKKAFDKTKISYKQKGKLVTKFNESSPEVQESILSGESKLEDIDVEIYEDYKKKRKDDAFGEDTQSVSVADDELDELISSYDKLMKEVNHFEKYRLEFCNKNGKARYKRFKKRIGE